MSEIKIKCPTCGKVLRLTETPNINAASFTCPVCNVKHVVGECERYTSAPKPSASSADETRYGNASSTTQQSGGDETRYAGNAAGPSDNDTTRTDAAQQAKVGMLVDANGAAYQLAIGFNTIGRKASSSTASVQIVTDDRTMSRNHAVIEVRQAGGQMFHILKNGANKNPSYLNNALVGQGDQLILNNGDRIKMGRTILTFKQ